MDWFAQSLLGFACGGLTLQEGFNIQGREGDRLRPYFPNQQPQTQFTALFLFDKCLRSDIWELSSAENVDNFSSSHCEVIVSLKPIPLLAVNGPQSSKSS